MTQQKKQNSGQENPNLQERLEYWDKNGYRKIEMEEE